MMLMLMIRMISTMFGNGDSDNGLRYQTMMDDDEDDGDDVDADDDDDVDDK